MKRGRALALKRWQAVADAEFDRDLLLWVVNVAADILKAEADSIKGEDDVRRSKLIEAIGLGGRRDRRRDDVRSIVASVDHECDLIEQGRRGIAAVTLKAGQVIPGTDKIPDRTLQSDETFPASDAIPGRRLQTGEKTRRRREAVAARLKLAGTPNEIDEIIRRALKGD